MVPVSVNKFFEQVDQWPIMYDYLKDNCPNPENCLPAKEIIPEYFRYIIFPWIRSLEVSQVQFETLSGGRFRSALDWVASKNFNCDNWFAGQSSISESIASHVVQLDDSTD